ncbi:MAG: ribulose-phosphate 3-epimerase [Bacteroidetes bacterium]|nr:ribulose-phosphate 3-epimerase [Bacteroidota bacterium]MBL7103041.1 ribulose-phosphate 3-epimerase [Bacteroidales bacterium]
MVKLIAPSLLSANFGNLIEDIEMVNHSQADWLHLDVMDGVFVPNISFGFPVIKYIKKYAKKPLDVHLMIVDPDRYFERFRKYGAEIISIHYEACTHLHRSVHAIKNLGMKAGVALNPHTNISILEDVLHDIDMVLIMSVNPGFSAQNFIENTYKKIRQLKKLILKFNAEILIEVDGGVDKSNAAKLFKAGADVLVAGNSIFSSADPQKTISDLKHISI